MFQCFFRGILIFRDIFIFVRVLIFINSILYFITIKIETNSLVNFLLVKKIFGRHCTMITLCWNSLPLFQNYADNRRKSRFFCRANGERLLRQNRANKMPVTQLATLYSDIGSSSRIRTYDKTVNSRLLYHWAIEELKHYFNINEELGQQYADWKVKEKSFGSVL